MICHHHEQTFCCPHLSPAICQNNQWPAPPPRTGKEKRHDKSRGGPPTSLPCSQSSFLQIRKHNRCHSGDVLNHQYIREWRCYKYPTYRHSGWITVRVKQDVGCHSALRKRHVLHRPHHTSEYSTSHIILVSFVSER